MYPPYLATVKADWSVPLTLASVLFGIWAAALLFGIITVQTYFYYKRFMRDPWYTRWLVGVLWILQGIEVGISSRASYGNLVVLPQDGFIALLKEPWYRSYCGTHGVVVAFAVQSFFLLRYWSVSRNLFVTIPLSLSVLLDFAFGVYCVWRSYRTPQSSIAALESQGWAFTVWLALAAASDVILAISLAFEMRKRRTGHHRTDSVLNRLALYGVATGAITATVVIILLFLFVVADRVEIFLLFVIPLGAVYIVTLLSNLHLRISLRTALEAPSNVELRHRKHPTHRSADAPIAVLVLRTESTSHI
ncbi:hypothetical protein DL93DRAFT_2225243 [Clavulina sp. PMI_390]|nr:hypothetical protein DL93DRAFT_2225243 [Clavulina sp. PMI_390]